MQLAVTEIGTDVGALIAETPDGPTLLVDPRLSHRQQLHLITALVSDEEFEALQDIICAAPLRGHVNAAVAG
jgi:hypothetical protein